MEFRLSSGRFSNEILISAVLKVYIKTKGKRRKRRIILHVCEKNQDGTFFEFATVRLRIKQKGWQEINLPFYLLKKLKHEPIKLHVECEKCNRKVRLILPKRRKSNKPKKMRALIPNGKRSPMIVINTRENLKHPFRKRNRRDITLPAELNDTFDEEEDIVDGYDNVYRVKSIEEKSKANGSRSYTVRMENREEEGEDEEDNDNDNDSGGDDEERASGKMNDMDVQDGGGDGGNTDINSGGVGGGFGGNGRQRNLNQWEHDYADSGGGGGGGGGGGEKNLEVISEDSRHSSPSESSEGATYNGDSDERQCCLTSRFISFRSIGLQHLVVEPDAGFVSSHCSEVCPGSSAPVNGRKGKPISRTTVQNRMQTTNENRSNSSSSSSRSSGNSKINNRDGSNAIDCNSSSSTNNNNHSNNNIRNDNNNCSSSNNNNNNNKHAESKSQHQQHQHSHHYPQHHHHHHHPHHNHNNLHHHRHPHPQQQQQQQHYQHSNHNHNHKHNVNTTTTNNNNKHHHLPPSSSSSPLLPLPSNPHHGHIHFKPQQQVRRATNSNPAHTPCAKGRNCERHTTSQTQPKADKAATARPRHIKRPLRCRPTAFKNLTIAFLTEDLEIENMTIPNVIVTKCGCR
uniref:TGF-beta family profile domain-containing protein n=1 Tax=Octopus bimaculoides TaxID=37653 RepID=A0A0L8H3X9_OCTBM